MRSGRRLVGLAATAGICAALMLAAPAQAAPTASPRLTTPAVHGTWTVDRTRAGATQVWTSSPTEGFNGGVRVAGDAIVEADSATQQVVALDTATGAVRWRAAVGSTAGTTSVWGATGDHVIATGVTAGGSDELVALDLATGARQWSRSYGSTISVAVDGDRVFAAGQQPDGTSGLNGLDAATGAVAWTVPDATWPSASSGHLYAYCVYTTTLCALDEATGAVGWRVDPPGGGSTGSLPIVLGTGNVMVTAQTTPETVHVYAAATGAQVWSSYQIGSDEGQTPLYPGADVAGDGDTLYAVTRGPYTWEGTPPPVAARLWAIDADTGAAKWVTTLPTSFAGGAFAFGDGVVLTACTFQDPNFGNPPGYACAFDASNGAPLDALPAGDAFVDGMGFLGGRLFVSAGLWTGGPGGAGIHAYDLADLAPVPGKIEAESTNSPALTAPADDTGGGRLVGYLSPSGQELDYPVQVAAAGTYVVTLRVASDAAALSPPPTPRLELQVLGTGVVGTVTVPETGGWQSWTSVQATVTLPAGPQRLRLYVPAGGYGFNINWFDVERAPATSARAAHAVPRTTSAQRVGHCLAGLRASARVDPAAVCFGS